MTCYFKNFLNSLIWVIILGRYVFGSHIKGLDDSILFKLNWLSEDEVFMDTAKYEIFDMITTKDEKFECLIPIHYGGPFNSEDEFVGLNALELLLPLFKKKLCTVRLENFWTYELCHGLSLKQYHEGREETGHLRYQDYVLGTTTLELMEKQAKEMDPKAPMQYTRLDGVLMPYVAVNYTDGSACDLTGASRRTRVLYVCFEEGRHSVFSVEEKVSCEYEVVVLTGLLCQHPKYRPHETPQTNLHCRSQDKTLKRPIDLVQLEAESLKLRTLGATFGGDLGDVESGIRVSPLDATKTDTDLPATQTHKIIAFPKKPPSIDKQLVADFLAGEHCLQGGSGWWKFEFCYGKTVEQYHQHKDGSRISVILGKFDLAAHKEWILKNPSKKFDAFESREASHMYTGGAYCSASSGPRRVEVKLKCQREAKSESAVSLYLLEPRVCDYVLSVESPLVCPLLDSADEFGLASAILLVAAGSQKNEDDAPIAVEEQDDEIDEDELASEHTPDVTTEKMEL